MYQKRRFPRVAVKVELNQADCKPSGKSEGFALKDFAYNGYLSKGNLKKESWTR